MWSPRSPRSPLLPPPRAAAAPATPLGGGRRKPGSAPAAKEWAVVTANGAVWREEAGRHVVMRRTGLPARDLRVLDPALSHPSTVLARERAVVVSLERVRAVVTASEVLVPCSNEHDVQPLVRRLASWVSASGRPAWRKQAQEAEGNDEKSPVFGATSKRQQLCGNDGSSPKVVYTLEELLSGDDDIQDESPRVALAQADVPPVARGGGAKVLPFEFIALEVCLQTACSSLEQEAIALEKEAYPALDQLTSKVSTLNLERIRQMKSRFVALVGRVQKVRDELEHLLEGDQDLAAMHLSEKEVYREAFDGVSSRFDVEKVVSDLDEEMDQHAEERPEDTEKTSAGFRPNTQELEMLLEAYFVQIEGTLNKLSILREYINDTEDYINIMLDDKQNQLLQFGVVLTTATMIVTVTVITAGFLSINIRIPLYRTTAVQFWEALGGMVISGIGLAVASYVWFKRSGFLR